jgi:ribosomal protein S26
MLIEETKKSKITVDDKNSNKCLTYLKIIGVSSKEKRKQKMKNLTKLF